MGDQSPVLIESTLEEADGFVPSKDWSNKPVTPVRRWRPSFNQNLKFSQLHKVTEQQRGSISAEEWARSVPSLEGRR
jgi:hypothetical protein